MLSNASACHFSAQAAGLSSFHGTEPTPTTADLQIDHAIPPDCRRQTSCAHDCQCCWSCCESDAQPGHKIDRKIESCQALPIRQTGLAHPCRLQDQSIISLVSGHGHDQCSGRSGWGPVACVCHAVGLTAKAQVPRQRAIVGPIQQAGLRQVLSSLFAELVIKWQTCHLLCLLCGSCLDHRTTMTKTGQ